MNPDRTGSPTTQRLNPTVLGILVGLAAVTNHFITSSGFSAVPLPVEEKLFVSIGTIFATIRLTSGGKLRLTEWAVYALLTFGPSVYHALGVLSATGALGSSLLAGLTRLYAELPYFAVAVALGIVPALFARIRPTPEESRPAR